MTEPPEAPDGSSLVAPATPAKPPFASSGRSAAQVTIGSVVFAATRLLAAPLAALAVAVLARTVGVESFGHLSVAFSIVAALNNIGDFGFGQVVVRELAADPDNESGLATAFLAARLSASMVLLFGALVFVAWAVPSSAFSATALIALTLPALAVTNLTAVAQARFRPQWQGVLSLAQAATWLGLVAIGAENGASLVWFGAAYLVAASVNAAGAVSIATRLVSIQLRAGRRHIRRLLAESWPLGVTGLFVTAYYHLDQVLLYRLSGPQASGLYGAAYRYLDVSQVLPATLLGAALPVLSLLRKRNSGAFERVAQLALTFALAIGAPVAIGGVLLADDIVRILYGSEFRAAAPLLAVLAPSVIVISLSYLWSGLLIVARRQSVLGWVAAPVAITNLALNIVLIPRFGALAAAWVTLATEIAVCVATMLIMVRITGLRLPIGRLLGCLSAAATMVLMALALRYLGVHRIGTALAGGIAYVAVLFASRGLTVADVRLLLDRRVLLDGT